MSDNTENELNNVANDTNTDVANDVAEQNTVTGAENAEVVTKEEDALPEVTKQERKMVPADVMERRIAKLTREKMEARREADVYKGLVDAGQEGGEGKKESQPTQQPTRQEVESQVRLDIRCNDIHAEGVEKFKDFDDSLRNIGVVFGGLPQAFLENVAELPNAAEVLYILGSDLEEAERVSEMSPHKQAIHLARLSAKLESKAEAAKTVDVPKTKPISSAPAPIDSGAKKGATVVQTDPSKMTMDEFVAWRSKQA